MEVIAFVVLIIICGLAAMWIYIGPWAMWLVIVAVIFGIYKLCKSGKKSETEKYDSSEYVVNALQFVEFYERLPQKSLFVVTPELIGVVIPDTNFGVAVKTYLSLSKSDTQQADSYLEWFLKEEKKQLGGEVGVEQFKKLGLQVKLHNDDEDWPVIYVNAFCYSDADREHYVKAIEAQYQKLYNKSFKIHHFNDSF